MIIIIIFSSTLDRTSTASLPSTVFYCLFFILLVIYIFLRMHCRIEHHHVIIGDDYYNLFQVPTIFVFVSIAVYPNNLQFQRPLDFHCLPFISSLTNLHICESVQLSFYVYRTPISILNAACVIREKKKIVRRKRFTRSEG